MTLRSAVAAALAAAALHLGLVAGSGPARADTFGIRKFSIPSTSMAPTLLINEYIVAVDRPRVARGDLAVHRLPKDNSTVDIKRVIGMPGDRVQIFEGRLHINGGRTEREALADFELRDAYDRPQPVRQYRETLPGGRSHRILEMSDNGFLDNAQEYVVPAGHYFMTGDNRDNSSDSRSLAQHGYVPVANIVGRPELVYFSLAEGESAWQFWRWPWSMEPHVCAGRVGRQWPANGRQGNAKARG
ncbi:MAG: signal peptidase I [Xanthobacteraceae bacterium]|nr:signal peptidase I [Xanthobacteraceae bacterium]